MLRYSKNYQLPLLIRRCYSTGSPLAEDISETEAEITRDAGPRINFNKSGLLPAHRNILHDRRPYNNACSWIHQTEKYQKKIFGRYGAISEIDPRICFPQQSAAIAQEQRRRISEPKSLQEMMKQVQDEEKFEEEKKIQREEYISKNMAKLDGWKLELHNKVKKKEADALAVRQKKERLVEEVRRHFGYKVSPREDRFKELLEQKEKEEKKKDKEARKLEREKKMLSKLTSTMTST